MTKKKSKKTENREMDKVWKEKVKDRDNYSCQVCGNKLVGINCQAHHILPRQLKKYRWDLDNGITLCYRCHKVGPFAVHQNAIWFTFWLKTNKLNHFKYILEKLREMSTQFVVNEKLLSNVVGRKTDEYKTN